MAKRCDFGSCTAAWPLAVVRRWDSEFCLPEASFYCYEHEPVARSMVAEATLLVLLSGGDH